MAHVSKLFYYPLKSGRRVEADALEITASGATGDRQYMVIDADGVLVSQREVTGLALVDAREVIASCQPTGNLVPIRLHRWTGEGEDQGDTVAGQLSALLDHPVRVVRFPDNYERRTSRGDGLARYQDGYPVTVTSQTSLDELNTWLDEPVPIERFRPTMVIDGLERPFEEDDLLAIRVGDVELELVGPTGRCVVTTIDQDTAAKGREPLRELGKRRVLPALGGGQEIMFAINTVVRSEGVVRVGDDVHVMHADAPYAERVTKGDERG